MKNFFPKLKKTNVILFGTIMTYAPLQSFQGRIIHVLTDNG